MRPKAERNFLSPERQLRVQIRIKGSSPSGVTHVPRLKPAHSEPYVSVSQRFCAELKKSHLASGEVSCGQQKKDGISAVLA